MKYLFIILFAAIGFAACQSDDKKTDPTSSLSKEEKDKALKDSANFTSITWLDSTTQNLGQIKEGQVIEISYRFKNTGNKPLVIADVMASCGCTVPEKPQEAIAPGSDGVIKAKFDSNGKPGEQHKTLTVIANTNPDTQYLNFQVQVSSE